jgi:tetratricopeptide (TPR) repeat protein
MGGQPELVYHAMYQVAFSMSHLDVPFAEVQDALLRAWEFRPNRAEALYAMAVRYRAQNRHWPAYQFAKLAAEIPFPETEQLFVNPDIYSFRATEEQAICAGTLGNRAEAFTLFRRLLARPGVPDDARRRIVGNRDVCVPEMIEAAAAYPDALVQRLVAGPRGAEVVVSLVAGPDRAATERTLNSFLRCCNDVARVGRFLIMEAGLSAPDREMLCERYGFIEFIQAGTKIDGRYWLHLGHGWRFFAPENLITRLTAVLEAETQVFQVGINFADAHQLTGTCAAEQAVRRTPDAGRYLLTDQLAQGPSMFDAARLERAGGLRGDDQDPIAALGRRAAAAGLRTASLDEVLCIQRR